MPEWGYKVGSTWDELVYVDAFAGPWKTVDADYADTSFGIAIEALSQCQNGLSERGRQLRMQAILVEQDKQAFNEIEEIRRSS